MSAHTGQDTSVISPLETTMPNNKRSKRSQRRRRVRTMVNDLPMRSIAGKNLPSAFITTMVYTNYLSLVESAVAVGAFNAFAVNDLYDPDFSSTGNQPIGYDQWAQFYTRMRVMGCRATFTFAARSGDPCAVGWMAHAQSTPTSSISAWAGQRFSDHRLIAGTSSGPSVTSFSVNIPLWDILSITKRQYVDESDYSQVVGAGPVRRVFLSPWVRGFGTAATVALSVRLEFRVELCEPVPLGLS